MTASKRKTAASHKGPGLAKFFGGAAQPKPEAPAPEPAPSAPAQDPKPELSDDLKKKIEENKRKALERKRARDEAASQQAESTQEKSQLDQPADTKPASQTAEPQAPAQVAGPPAKKPANDFFAKRAAASPVTAPAASPTKSAVSVPKVTPEKEPLPPEKQKSPRGIATSSSAASPQGAPVKAKRAGLSVERCDKFGNLFSRKSWDQYTDLYSARVEKMRTSVLAEAQSLWAGDVGPQAFVSHLRGTQKTAAAQDLVLVGILFKELKQRVNVIDQYQSLKVGSTIPPEDLRISVSSEDDELFLENKNYRVRLLMPLEHSSRLTTGLVVAVRGTQTQDGDIRVSGLGHICFPKAVGAPSIPNQVSEKSDAGPFFALVSGLMIGNDTHAAARNRAIEFLLGRSEGKHSKEVAAAVQHVIICGGTLADNGAETVGEADKLLGQLAAEVPVDVLPGRNEPSNACLPQAPLHPHLFRQARRCKDFRSVSNPYDCKLDGVHVLGHSGQPVNDITRCTKLSPIEAVNLCLEACHMAPTCPDTMPMQPYTDSDPFVMEAAPNIFFSGGHEKATHDWRPSASGNGTMCICVPSFKDQPAIVLVNVRNVKDVRVLEFGDDA